MEANKRGISADLLIHPGETISDVLEEIGRASCRERV